MNSHDGFNARDLLDAYLDGMLEGDQLAAFERVLATDPVLQAEVEAQTSINTSLERLFHRAEPVPLPEQQSPSVVIAPPAPTLRLTDAPPSPAAPASPSVAPSAAATWGSRRISPMYGVAAVLVFAALAGLYISGVVDPSRWFESGLINAADVYARKVRTGFNPDWVCTTDEEFVQNTRKFLDEPLLIRSTDSVEVVGWSYYEHVLSTNTVILLTTVDKKEVIVVMDSRKHDRRLNLPKSSGLYEHTLVVGNAVLKEVSPFPEPRVLPLVERK